MFETEASQVSYMILQRVSPVTHSIGNCIKRVIIIIAAVVVFQNPMPLQNQIGMHLPQPLIEACITHLTVGTAVALGGVFLYSQAKRMSKKKEA